MKTGQKKEWEELKEILSKDYSTGCSINMYSCQTICPDDDFTMIMKAAEKYVELCPVLCEFVSVYEDEGFLEVDLEHFYKQFRKTTVRNVDEKVYPKNRKSRNTTHPS